MASRLAHPLLIPTEDEIDLFAVMSALSDPVRRAIVSHIASHPGGACSSSNFGVTKSALTRHWKILREAGLIRQEVDGTRHRNWLRADVLARRFPGLLPLVLDAIDTETVPEDQETPPPGGSKEI